MARHTRKSFCNEVSLGLACLLHDVIELLALRHEVGLTVADTFLHLLEVFLSLVDLRHGFAKNSRNLAQFDITPYLNKKGENVVAVEVYRHSDGSFLESQDMFRLPGIFRSVSLTAKPMVQVRDFKAIPDYDETFTRASLKIEAEVRNLGKKDVKGYKLAYKLYANTLFAQDNTPLDVTTEVPVSAVGGKGQSIIVSATLDAGTAVKPWSAEKPQCYTLVGELKDAKGKVVETFSTNVGFRKIEIKDTPAEKDEFGLAGRYYYLNGQPIKMKGVNRHENNPETGHTVSRAQMEKEVFLMKQGNINHVRTATMKSASMAMRSIRRTSSPEMIDHEQAQACFFDRVTSD